MKKRATAARLMQQDRKQMTNDHSADANEESQGAELAASSINLAATPSGTSLTPSSSAQQSSTRLLKSTIIRLNKAATSSTASQDTASPTLSTSTSPSPPSLSPSPPPALNNHVEWDLNDLIRQYATNQSDDESGGEEVDEDDATSDGDGGGDGDGPPAASSTANKRLLPNTRFLSSIIQSTLRHNERVEHVDQPMMGVENKLLNADEGGSPLAKTKGGRTIVTTRNGGTMQMSNMQRSVAKEAARLIATVEGQDIPPPTVARKVRGRGKGTGRMQSDEMNGATAAAAASSAASVASSSSPVAATPASNDPSYHTTHARYRRARGVALLHCIARAYNIDIIVQPPRSSDEETESTTSAAAAAAPILVKNGTGPTQKPHGTIVLNRVGDGERIADDDEDMDGIAAGQPRSISSGSALAKPKGSNRLFASLSNTGQQTNDVARASSGPSASSSLSSRPALAHAAPSSHPIRTPSERGQQAASIEPATLTSFTKSRHIMLQRSSSSITGVTAPTSDSVGPSSVITTAPPRKVVNLKSHSHSSSQQAAAGNGVPASSSPSLSLSPEAVSTSTASAKISLVRKRKVDPASIDEQKNGSNAATHATPSSTSNHHAATGEDQTVSTTTPSTTPASAPPPPKRRRAGGILGAALQAILPGSNRR